MGTQPVVHKQLCGQDGSRSEHFRLRIIVRLRIVAHVAATTDILASPVAEDPRQLLVASSHRCKSSGMCFTGGIDTDKHLQSLPTGTDEKGQCTGLLTEQGSQPFRVGHMIEIKPHNATILLQLVGTVPTSEHTRRGETGKLPFLFTGSLLIARCQGGTIGCDNSLPTTGADQDDYFFQCAGDRFRQIQFLEKGKSRYCIHML